MKNIEKISELLFDKIRSRFEHVTLGDEQAKDTTDAEQARFFNFDYISSAKKNYGNITLSLADETSLKVYFSKNLSEKIKGIEQQEWFDFLRGLRLFAKRNLLKFDTRDINRDNLNIRDVEQAAKSSDVFTANEKSVTESKLHGNSRTSYQDMGPVRLVVKHSDVINDEVRGARSRKIDSMFIETTEGERFRMPFKKLSAGRAMAEHISHGGQVHDGLGQHIVQMVDEMSKLGSFVRGTKHRMFEDEETKDMCEAAAERYHELNSGLKKLGGGRGYKEYAESFMPEQPHDTTDIDLESLKERFMKKMFDDRMTDALPYVYQAHQRRQQANENKYIREFDDWADDMTDDDYNNQDGNGISDGAMAELKELMKEPLAVGIDGSDAINALNDTIEDDALFSDILDLSRRGDSDADARPLVVQWIEQHQTPAQSLDPIPDINSTPDNGAAAPTPPVSTGEAAEPHPHNEDINSMRRLAGLR